MSYRTSHDYDNRDVITCVTLSDTRPVARILVEPGDREPGVGVDVAFLFGQNLVEDLIDAG